MDWNYTACSCQNCAAIYNVTEIYCEHLPLLYNCWFIIAHGYTCIATSHVVSLLFYPLLTKLQRNFTFDLNIFRFPFDVKNLFGYLIACVLEYTMVSYVFYFIACIISLSIESFVILMGLINDLNDNLKTINEIVKTNGTHFQIMCQLYEFVQFHSQAKQLSLWKY